MPTADSRPCRCGTAVPPGTTPPPAWQCVSQYKTRPVKAKIRELLGYPPPTRVPRGIYAELAVGLAAEEISRARDPDVRYLHFAYPLADLGWTTADCRRYLIPRGMTGAPPSACLGCPYHGNRWWRYLRDHEADQWADVVAFDHAIRHGHPRATDRGQQLRGRYYLHMSRQPLDQARLGPIRVLKGLSSSAEDGIPGGCSPWTRPAVPAPPCPPAPTGKGRAALVRRCWAGAISLRRAVARRLTGGLPRQRGGGHAVTLAGRRHQ